MGGVGNYATEEDWHWDLNPGVAAIRGLFWDQATWAEKNHGLLFLFLRYGILDWAEGEGRCVYGYSKGFWDLNEEIKLLLLSLYNF